MMLGSTASNQDTNTATSNKDFHSPLLHQSLEAPVFPIPDTTLVSVEHPYIIQDLDKGVASLGGFQKLDAVCNPAFFIFA